MKKNFYKILFAFMITVFLVVKIFDFPVIIATITIAASLLIALLNALGVLKKIFSR